MAITLGSVGLSDAEVTDGIGRGDVAAAARLWVRHWPTALTAARRYVEADEVPGLAAEALIGTIAAIAVGRGPREDLSSFVTDAVTELGESDEPPPASSIPAPELFLSPMMTRAFAGLSGEDQEILRLASTGDEGDRVIADELDLPLELAAEARRGALSALQRDYLAEHTEHAESAACHQAHGAMAAAVTRDVPLVGETWVHMSECAWCTEAFHDLAFSNVALDVLVDRALLVPPVVPPVVLPVVPPVVPVSVVAAEVIVPDATTKVAVAPLLEEQPPVPLEAEPVPSRSHAAAFSPVSLLRGRRTRIAAGALVAAAAITAAVLVITGPGSTDRDLAASGTGTEQTPDDPTALPDVFDSVAPPVVDEVRKPTEASVPPTPAAVVTSAPSAGAVVEPTPEAPSNTPQPTATASPGATPKPSPTATSEPSPSEPAGSPTPTPTTPPCGALAHFFGFC